MKLTSLCEGSAGIQLSGYGDAHELRDLLFCEVVVISPDEQRRLNQQAGALVEVLAAQMGLTLADISVSVTHGPDGTYLGRVTRLALDCLAPPIDIVAKLHAIRAAKEAA